MNKKVSAIRKETFEVTKKGEPAEVRPRVQSKIIDDVFTDAVVMV